MKQVTTRPGLFCQTTRLIRPFWRAMKSMNRVRITIIPLTFLSLYSAISQTRTVPEPADFEVQNQAAAAADTLPDTFSKAKNVIVFLGDGMGLSTITAARILDGQQKGGQGEENSLFFESFPYTAFSKTYSVNLQTPDSASTMTAIMTGHKTMGYVVGYDRNVIVGDHTSTIEFGGPSKHLTTLVEKFEEEGKSTGIVTTTRVTHATPAACYAHSPSRFWESGNYIKAYKITEDERYEAAVKAGFKDIALQLIEFPYGNGIDVVLGGGRRGFLPEPSTDSEENADTDDTIEVSEGIRLDGRNLIEEWGDDIGRKYVSTQKELMEIDPATTRQLLGLFKKSDMSFEADASLENEERIEPPLHEMALAALKILRKNPEGFFLLVEGGRIDHAHHLSNAHRALTETVEFDKSIRSVYEALTERERKETLIVVTADHSHTFTLAGYPARGNPILGKVVEVDKTGAQETDLKKDAIGLPYTTLGYHNGGGFPGMMINTNTLDHAHGPKWQVEISGEPWKYINIPRSARPDLTLVDTESLNYRQEAAIPLAPHETQAGEDVSIHATGPGSHLFRGTREQNYIYHAIIHALEKE